MLSRCLKRSADPTTESKMDLVDPPVSMEAVQGPSPEPASHKISGKMVLPPNALSITERFFYNSPPGKPQVVMTFVLRLQPPPQVPTVTIQRMVDILRIAASSHHRLISYIDPKTQTTHPLGRTAADFDLPYRVVRREKESWAEEFQAELNTNFDIGDTGKPLWRVTIIAGEGILGEEGEEGEVAVERELEVAERDLMEKVKDNVDDFVEVREDGREVEEGRKEEDFVVVDGNGRGNVGGLIVRSGGKGKYNLGDHTSFDVMFSFHHCLGDGLSMFAFARTFTGLCDAEHFNSPDLHLESIRLAETPPPIIDNLVNPWLVEVLPVAAGMAFRYLGGKRHAKFQGRKGNPNLRDSLPADRHRPQPMRTDSSASSTSSITSSPAPIPDIPSVAVATSTMHGETDDDASIFPPAIAPHIPPAISSALSSFPTSLSRPATTNVRFLWFDEAFTTTLRTKAKFNGTTIAAVLVVNALAAVRSTYGAWEKYKNAKMPERQGWVVTNSVRHMLPGSNLVNGSDKESDPALNVFGGYSGSAMNNSLHITDRHDFWERCRTVRRSIAFSFRSSIQRLKLINYTYRHQKIWKAINRNTDLSKLSRAYSVEVANLGAWKYPGAGPDAGVEDERMRICYFAGLVNASFDGARGLFTVGVLTLGGNMSVSVGYDSKAVSEKDADIFVKSFVRGMEKLKDAEGKVTVLDVRTS